VTAKSRWTLEEDAIIADDSLTLEEKLARLDRTERAIKSRQQKFLQSPNDKLIECAICHKLYRSLAKHTLIAHGITTDEYRVQFPGHPIVCPSTSNKLATHKGKKRPNHGPKVRAALKGRKPSPQCMEAAAKSAKERLLDPRVQAVMQAGVAKYYETHHGHAKGRFGSLNYNWRGGSSFEPYSPEFNRRLKKKVRKRDGYQCRLCDMSQKEHLERFGKPLSVHHINYCKTDHSMINLITLCMVCHGKTNGNREYYENLLTNMQAGLPHPPQWVQLTLF